MNRRAAVRLGVLAFLAATAVRVADAQAPVADAAEARSRPAMSVTAANLRAGITISPSGAGIGVDTAAAGTGTHRRAHAARGAAIGAVTGASAGALAAALVISADRRHPERHGGQADYRPSAGYLFMGILGVLGAGAGALTGAALGALIP